VRDTGGEYLALLFLRDGSLGLVAPIQDERQHRFGFSWWRIGHPQRRAPPSGQGAP
jgi:hypothetical protein